MKTPNLESIQAIQYALLALVVVLILVLLGAQLGRAAGAEAAARSCNCDTGMVTERRVVDGTTVLTCYPRVTGPKRNVVQAAN